MARSFAVELKSGESIELPSILYGYMETTDQFCEAPFSKEHVLNEAMWCLSNAYDNEGSAAYAAHPQSKKALARFVEKLKQEGVVPRRDFD